MPIKEVRSSWKDLGGTGLALGADGAQTLEAYRGAPARVSLIN